MPDMYKMITIMFLLLLIGVVAAVIGIGGELHHIQKIRDSEGKPRIGYVNLYLLCASQTIANLKYIFFGTEKSEISRPPKIIKANPDPNPDPLGIKDKL